MIRSTGLRSGMRGLAAVGAVALGLTLVGTTATAVDDPDPRIGLGAGVANPGSASSNMELLANSPKPAGFFNPANLGSLSFANSDIAFQGDKAFVGSFNGFQIYDVSDPADPELEMAYVCPGGQGDLSIYGDLLFMSVEETRGKIDCSSTPAATAETRFRGVRIFDISDLTDIRQLPGVQTCAGSHTHSLVVPPGDDPESIFVYNSGTAGIRSATELEGCNGNSSLLDPTTTNFAIQVIEVPLAAPETARVVNNSRIFSVCGDNSCEDDFADGALNGLPGSGRQPLYEADDPRAPGGQSRSQASRCHDLTAYPEIGLMAGACQGWGLLIDISDPVNPKRIHAVEDYNFAYWHSASFNNDGTKVIFTDEWGGGTGARCRPTDNENWGANALFEIVDTPEGKKMEWASYYKLPVPQTSQENCVAHNGSLIPVPGRDIMVQAWYQGGTSVFDFTDTENPTEIAFFDRGPLSATQLITGGHWSSYWYNGNIIGSEIARGFDTFELTPSEHMSVNDLAAALEWSDDEVNVQMQERFVHAPSWAVVRSLTDTAERMGTLSPEVVADIREHVDTAESLLGIAKVNKRAVQAQFEGAIRKAGPDTMLGEALTGLRSSVL
jgi:hypothetical protein